MSNIRASRSQLVAPAVSASGAVSWARELARDAWGFVRLLNKTLSSLPAGVLRASVVINLLGLALPLAILQVYDRIIPHAAISTLVLLIIGVFCAVMLETALRIARNHVVAWNSMKLAWRANIDAAARIVAAPAEIADAQPTARWIQRLQAVSAISEFQVSPSPLVLIDLVFAVIFLALLFVSNAWLAAVPITVFILFSVVAIQRGRELRNATAGRISAEMRIRDFLIEVMSGIVTVKALGAENQILRRFERLSQQAAGYTNNVVQLTDDAQSFASTVSILTQIATATIGAILAVDGEISIGIVACSTMLAGRVIQPLLRLVSAWNEIQAVLVAEETAGPIFRLPKCDRLSALPPLRAAGPAGLVFDAVSFSSGGSRKSVLSGASLDVRPGEFIAITGADNIGKSAVARLAAGQLSPQGGTVLVDGVPATSAADASRGALAIVDQANAIVRGSVLSNLTLFSTGERLDAAREAVRLIGLQDDINRLPRGYDTPLGGAATETLPTGFLQRIVIARALAGHPRLLILDEANNAFDHASDLALSNGLITLKGRITLILITNRPSFAAIADRQFTIADGKFQRIEPRSLPSQKLVGTGGI